MSRKNLCLVLAVVLGLISACPAWGQTASTFNSVSGIDLSGNIVYAVMCGSAISGGSYTWNPDAPQTINGVTFNTEASFLPPNGTAAEYAPAPAQHWATQPNYGADAANVALSNIMWDMNAQAYIIDNLPVVQGTAYKLQLLCGTNWATQKGQHIDDFAFKLQGAYGPADTLNGVDLYNDPVNGLTTSTLVTYNFTALNDTFRFEVTNVGLISGWILSTAPTVTYTPGDANGDGKVDDNDLGILLGNWGTGTTWAEGNFKGTGVVDDNDLGTLLGAWTGSGAAAPEPVSLSLLAIGGIAMLRRKATR